MIAKLLLWWTTRQTRALEMAYNPRAYAYKTFWSR
jgi:hypothetical protein